MAPVCQLLEVTGRIQTIVRIPAWFSSTSWHPFITAALDANQASLAFIITVAIASAIRQQLVRIFPEPELRVLDVIGIITTGAVVASGAIDIVLRAAPGSTIGQAKLRAVFLAVTVIAPVIRLTRFLITVVLGHRPSLAGMAIGFHLWRLLVAADDTGIRIIGNDGLCWSSGRRFGRLGGRSRRRRLAWSRCR